MPPLTGSRVARRVFLRQTGAIVAVGVPLLAACGSPAAAPSPTSGAATAPGQATQPKPAAAGAKLPSFIPNPSQKPDLPGSADGLVSPGWTSYPKQLFQAVPEPPGTGGEVTVTLETNNPPMPPLDQNAQWQAINKAMNAKTERPDDSVRGLRRQVGRDPGWQRPAGHHVHDHPTLDADRARLPRGQVHRPDAVSGRRRDQGLPQPGRAAQRARGRAP